MTRRLSLVLLVLVMGAALIPANAQGDFTPEQQAALDALRAAYGEFLALDSYTVQIEQVIDQGMEMQFAGQTITVLQKISSAGQSQVELSPGTRIPNQAMSLSQFIVQDLGAAGGKTELGPMVFEMIALNNRYYLRIQMPEGTPSVFPTGWHDVTEGAAAFPGLNMMNIEQMFELSYATLDTLYIDAMLTATQEVEILGSDTLDGVPVNRYRLELDVSFVKQVMGLDRVEQMFNSEALGIDVQAVLDQLYDPANTGYSIEMALGAEDGLLYGAATTLVTKMSLTPEMITNPALAGATVDIDQTITQSAQFGAFNEPVDITAPETVN